MENIMINLCEKYGTPLYVYDSGKITTNYNNFINAFSTKKFKVYYACKALTNINILKLFCSLGAGLDCVSIEEIELGLRAGFKPQQILFTPNNVSESEYKKAIKFGVKINVDNINFLEFIGTNYKECPICIRINPHLMAGGNRKISVGHIDSKFGISIHQFPLVKRMIKNFQLNVEGIHVHSGSDIIDPDIFIRAAELIFTIVEELDTVEYIDFGSGFKVKYNPNDLHTDIESFGKTFSNVFNAFCKKMNKEYTLQFEPGKYMVSEAGYFLTKVNTVKQTTSCVFVGIDSGFNHLIRPMFYDSYHEIINISNPNGNKKLYNVVGYICESDTFATDRMLNEVRKNDILMFKNAGAYCFSMSSNYNSRIKPAEVLLHNGNDYLIRKRETIDDIIRNEIDVNIF